MRHRARRPLMDHLHRLVPTSVLDRSPRWMVPALTVTVLLLGGGAIASAALVEGDSGRVVDAAADPVRSEPSVSRSAGRSSLSAGPTRTTDAAPSAPKPAPATPHAEPRESSSEPAPETPAAPAAEVSPDTVDPAAPLEGVAESAVPTSSPAEPSGPTGRDVRRPGTHPDPGGRHRARDQHRQRAGGPRRVGVRVRGRRAPTFACSVDDGDFEPCESGEEIDDLEAGWHALAVRATDLSGTPTSPRPSGAGTPPGPETRRPENESSRHAAEVTDSRAVPS